jgi:hypothetical protein
MAKSRRNRNRNRRYSRRKNLKKRRYTNKRRQYGGIGMTTSVDTNPNEMNEEEYMLARQMRIIN